ncbi:MAG: anthranilate synthase component I family protein [Acidobacteria bacterium]|nr:anthranilate synthase component I family protein [Acidobacteriota bacterium]
MPSVEISERWREGTWEGPEDLFSLPGGPAFGLLHGGDWVIFGEDPLWVLADLDLPELRWDRRGDLPPLLPDFMGFAAYELGFTLDPVLGAPRPAPWPFPACHFALHRRVRLLHRPSGRAWEALREGPAPLGLRHGLKEGPFRAVRIGDSDGPERFQEKVRRIREEIRRGDVYQANLCRQESWSFQGDLRNLARRLALENPAPHSALIAAEGWALLSTSPESFLKLQDGRLESRPIKGTAPREADPVADRARAEGLLASAKDRSELAMIVDLVRNDLSRVCAWPSVQVGGFPRLESFANVHHLVAAVEGRIREGVSLRDLFAGLFPAASITGCPKLAAMALLRELEDQPRLASTGALGWFRHDLGQADLAVAIRTLSVGPGELRLGLGSGIVWDSEPEAEYLETIAKGSSLVRCLSS